MTKEEAWAKFRHDLKQVEHCLSPSNYLLLVEDARALQGAALSDTLGMLEALAKTRREASWGGFPEDLMVHWTPETGFEYFSGTKGKLTREQARAEAEALLEGNGG